MKVLVTGAAGYIGSVLCGVLLYRGHEVVAVDTLECGAASLVHLSSHEGFTFRKLDVRNRLQMGGILSGGVQSIVALAAVVGMRDCDLQPTLAREVNVDAVRTLMELRWPSQRVVFPNTNSGYGSRMDVTTACTEETPLSPVSLYGKLKAEAEGIVLEKPNTVSLRLATVFGVSPRMRRDLLVNDFVWKAMKERRIEVYQGNAMRNFVHVLDVAETLARFATGSLVDGVHEGVFNFGNDSANLSKIDLASKVAHSVAGHVSSTLPMIVTEVLGEDPDRRNYIVSSAKLAKAGIVAKRGLDQGIQELIRAYRCMPELYAA